MTVDRKLWEESFTNELPHWSCPTCQKGYLALLPDKFLNVETGPSKSAHDHEAWEPEWTQTRFVGLLECSMPACKELVAVSGSGSISIVQISYDECMTDTHYEVECLRPTPVPISYPHNTPEQVTTFIREASSLLWQSANASANKIRQAVESIMDNQNIDKKTASGKDISLHHRIKNFSELHKENGDFLLAIKWLGNSGSHADGISRNEVLDAFDMIEFVLESLYGNTKAQLLEKVAAVNAVKGPVCKP